MPATVGEVYREQLRELDAGPLWFVAVLLLVSTVYSLLPESWRATGPPLSGGPAGRRAGGWHWQSAVVAGLEGAISVSAAIYAPELFRRHGWSFGPASRAAYGAYVLQAPVLVALALLMRPVAVPAGIKFLVLVSAGIGLCFTLSAVLVRVPGVRRIL
jgi:hypothetical protein